MEARWLRCAALGCALLVSLGASHRTPNFVVGAASPELARQVGEMAEKYRRELAELWLGQELPRWAQPCPITVEEGPQLGAGGATSFLFDRGEVFGWRMNIQGPAARILDSVLPHEVTHTIFASHFRQPLPRWADEGACTTVEHDSERTKHRHMLISFLRTGRGIAFSQMFVMKDYPRDVMPLYAQGYSVASFLIGQGGRRKFIGFLEEGLKGGNWTGVVEQHYGYASLGELQNSWLDWVRQGSPLQDLPQPRTSPHEDGTLVAATGPRPSAPRPNLVFHDAASPTEGRLNRSLVPVRVPDARAATPTEPSATRSVADPFSTTGPTPPPWTPGGTTLASPETSRDTATRGTAPRDAAATTASAADRTRPGTIVEWSRREDAAAGSRAPLRR